MRLKQCVLPDDAKLAYLIDQKGGNVIITDEEDIQREIARPAQKLVLAFLKRNPGLLQQREALFRKTSGFLDGDFQPTIIAM